MVTFVEQLIGIFDLAFIAFGLGTMLVVYSLEIILKAYVRFELWQLDREFNRIDALTRPVYRFDKTSGSLRDLSSHGNRLRNS
jgi:hypothetical protein